MWLLGKMCRWRCLRDRVKFSVGGWKRKCMFLTNWPITATAPALGTQQNNKMDAPAERPLHQNMTLTDQSGWTRWLSSPSVALAHGGRLVPRSISVQQVHRPPLFVTKPKALKVAANMGAEFTMVILCRYKKKKKGLSAASFLLQSCILCFGHRMWPKHKICLILWLATCKEVGFWRKKKKKNAFPSIVYQRTNILTLHLSLKKFFFLDLSLCLLWHKEVNRRHLENTVRTGNTESWRQSTNLIIQRKMWNAKFCLHLNTNWLCDVNPCLTLRTHRKSTLKFSWHTALTKARSSLVLSLRRADGTDGTWFKSTKP